MAKPPLTAIIDTCFWLAICDSKDDYHQQAVQKDFDFDKYHILLPWPCLYETINTKFVKNPRAIGTFERLAKKPNLDFIDDTRYRQDAYGQIFQFASQGGRPISLVDMVIRFMLDDVNIRVRCLVTFNVKDFVDICRKRQIVML